MRQGLGGKPDADGKRHRQQHLAHAVRPETGRKTIQNRAFRGDKGIGVREIVHRGLPDPAHGFGHQRTDVGIGHTIGGGGGGRRSIQAVEQQGAHLCI